MKRTIFCFLIMSIVPIMSGTLIAQTKKAAPKQKIVAKTKASPAPKPPIKVIAYYSGGPEKIDALPANSITHIIFCFGHLKGNNFSVGTKRDSLIIEKMVQMKKRNPALKVILSLGGWGGCEMCSPVFATEFGRHEFAMSVFAVSNYFKTDGIDLDWEYPTIEGYPNHTYGPADKSNFTALVQDLRSTLNPKAEISFAAGGFQKFLDESVDWAAVVPLVDRINMMTYDLVNGNSTQTGHHTSLYSRPGQAESTDNAITALIKMGVPANKLVVGAAFYGRMWENVSPENNGLYNSGKFKSFVDYKSLVRNFMTPEGTGMNGFTYYWDGKASAPYLYNPEKMQFITFDNKRSMGLKTAYVINKNLNGIMFWELNGDADKGGLLDEINKTKATLKR